MSQKKQEKMNKKLTIFLIIAITLVAVGSLLLSIFLPQGTPTSQKILINEVMASNKSAVVDDTGQYSDWIELYNPSDSAVSLSGWGLSDSKSVPVKWAFPDVEIPAGGYMVIYCSKQDHRDEENALHTNFGLSADGEAVVLTDNLGNIVDYIGFEQMPSDTSLGRDPEDQNKWKQFEKVTPGFPNTDQGHTAYMASLQTGESTLKITEVMSTNIVTLSDDYGEAPDWVEIYNSGDKEINLKGYGLSDKPNKAMKWTFPEVTIQPQQYLIVYCSGKGQAKMEGDNTYLHTNFRISNYEETIVLSSPKGQVLDSVEVPQLKADTSYALNLSTKKWSVTSQATPGKANTDAGFRDFTQQASPTSNVFLSEAMLYNDTIKSAGDKYYDWVELYNAGSTAVNLKGWGITDDTEKPLKWKFPDVTIGPGEYLVVYCSGLDKTSGGELHASFRLSSKGEVLGLTDNTGKIVDHLCAGNVPSNMSFGRQLGSTGFFYFPNPSLGSANSGGAYGFAQTPVIETPGGSFRGAQQVTISTQEEGAVIRYTTDGSTPTSSSPQYTGPITVSKTTPIRARAFKDALLGSTTATTTYFIDVPHTLPIVSLVSDPDNLFGYERGIYTIGKGTDDSALGESAQYKGANFWNDWEREAHFEYVQEDGKVGVSLDGGVKIFGAYSRKMDQKGLSFFARSRYGTDMIEYPLFETRPYTEYKSIVLRASGQDALMTKIRDITITDLIRENTNVEVAAFRQAVLYINGQYWGIYNIREKINKYMIAQHNDIENPENIDLLVANSRVLVGDNSDYKALEDYIETHDVTDPEVYAEIGRRMDIQNFIDWNIIEAWSNNADLGNIKYWRERSPEGKWRWIAYDFDWAFFHSNPNSLNGLARITNEKGMGATGGISTMILRRLLQNSTFKELFLERYAYHLSNTFATDRVLAKIEELSSNIEDEIGRDRERWDSGTVDGWRNQLKRMTNFVEVRNGYMIYFAREYFGLSEQETIERFGSAGTKPPAASN